MLAMVPVPVIRSSALLEWWGTARSCDLLRGTIHSKPGQVDSTGATNETGVPQQQPFLRSNMELPRDLMFDAALRRVERLPTDSRPTGGPSACASRQEIGRGVLGKITWGY